MSESAGNLLYNIGAVGISEEDAHSVWAGSSRGEWNSVSTIEPPNLRVQFESTVYEVARQRRQNIPPSLAQKALLADVLRKNGINVTEEV